MVRPLSAVMQPTADIIVYSPEGERVLVVEVKGGNALSAEHAARLRRNLLTHELVSSAPYFLLAQPTELYLWKPETPADRQADFAAAAQPVLGEYLGALVKSPHGLRGESLEIAFASWLGDLAAGLRKPRDDWDADQLLVKSGLYKKLVGGEVKAEPRA